MARRKTRLDDLFEKYLPDVDRDDPLPCWHWRGPSYSSRPYVFKHKDGFRINRRPAVQPLVRYNGKLQQPVKVLFEELIHPIPPGMRLSLPPCRCCNPYHRTLLGTPSYMVPGYGTLDHFIETIIQPTENFDFEEFLETWADEIGHIPKEVLHAKTRRPRPDDG